MRDRLWKWARGLALGLAALLLAAALFFALAPQGWAALHTALFVLQVLDVPFKPQPWFALPPVRQEVSYSQADGAGLADIYRLPGDGQRAAVLLFLGANAAGRDDPDVVNLGNALARAGFVAMFHWSPTMALQFNIDSKEIENLVWAFQHLRAQEVVDPQRVGLGGFSVGASFALVAAADPRIRDQVAFVNVFGPYYDAHDLLLQMASRSRFYQGQSEPWDPDPLTLRVFVNELVEAQEDPWERELLRDLLVRRVREGQEVPNSELAGLSSQGQAVYRLSEGTTLEEAETLYQALPIGFRQDMARISPSTYVAGLKARLLIMHDRDDRLIPVGESRRLAEAVKSRGNFRYTEVLAFRHVRPELGGDPWQLAREGYKLYRHMYGIIRVAA